LVQSGAAGVAHAEGRRHIQAISNHA